MRLPEVPGRPAGSNRTGSRRDRQRSLRASSSRPSISRSERALVASRCAVAVISCSGSSTRPAISRPTTPASQSWPAVVPLPALLGGVGWGGDGGRGRRRRLPRHAGAYPAMRAARLSLTEALA
ncbi:hypothetical protein F4560_007146 [Saccharothrix ecbatanensis]|uniref:Uncharacterized protein n=1 Tax=Saccharothrix ecbatanensis TaxID=1105145 RepID=A0A7W9HS33_9PSEU|nr:hypothetical protein [Saccharothrix ecbatanensis]MBB5807378.1 hypothetical protein [Saccharothrix ecbatanensis]